MVINHIEDDGNACLMHGLHHLLELLDTTGSIVGIGRVTSLGHVVVHRVVAPVILRLIEACLIN